MLKIFLLLFSFSSYAQISYEPLYNHTAQEREMVEIAERLSNEMAQSDDFEQFMVDREAGKHSSQYKLHTTNGKSAKEVVRHIKSASLSVPVHMYSKWYSSVKGYRNPPYPDVYTNRKFHAGATACSRASNLMHEWSHVLGYDHDFKATKRRPFSVPYSINAAFKNLCSCVSMKACKILRLNESEPVSDEPKLYCKRLWYTLWIKKKCYRR